MTPFYSDVIFLKKNRVTYIFLKENLSYIFKPKVSSRDSLSSSARSLRTPHPSSARGLYELHIGWGLLCMTSRWRVTPHGMGAALESGRG